MSRQVKTLKVAIITIVTIVTAFQIIGGECADDDLHVKPSCGVSIFTDDQDFYCQNVDLSSAGGFTLEFAVKIASGDNLYMAYLFDYGRTTASSDARNAEHRSAGDALHGPGSWRVTFNEGFLERRLAGVCESGSGKIGGETPAFSLDDGSWHQIVFSVGRTADGRMRSRLYFDVTNVYERLESWLSLPMCGEACPFPMGVLAVGSRIDGKYKFRGKIAAIRLSRRELRPEEFLGRFVPPDDEPTLGSCVQYDVRWPQWKRPRTTRRYLHGPLSERMVTLWVEGKVLLGEVDYSRPMEWSRLYSEAVWLVHGKDDRPLPWRESRPIIPSDGIPLHGQEYRIGDLRVMLECAVPFGVKPSASIRVSVENIGMQKMSEDFALLFRCGEENALVFSGPDVYNSHNPSISQWMAITNRLIASRNELACGGDAVSVVNGNVVVDERNGALRFSAELEPGEAKTWDFALSRGNSPRADRFDSVRAAVAADWQRELRRLNRLPKAIVADSEKSRIATNLVVQLLQCFCRVKDEDAVLFRQGGLSRCIWTWESLAPFRALSEFGDFNYYVRPAIDYWFAMLQDEDGKIDTRRFNWMPWASTTGCCLNTFACHALATGDRAYFAKWRDAAFAAFQYIRHTRCTTIGNPTFVEGLFPPLGACDWGEKFQCWGFTDLPNLAGIERFADACERFGDSHAPEVRAEANAYRATISGVMSKFREKSRGQDEFRVPLNPTGEDQELMEGYYPLLHHGAFAAMGFLDKNELQRLRTYMLRRGMAHPIGLYGRMFWSDGYAWFVDHLWYTTVQEFEWFKAFRRNGMDDLASDTLNALYRCAMTDECYMSERYWDVGEWYIPWSPNASANGRFLLMLADSEGLPLADPRVLLPGVTEEHSRRFALPPTKVRGEGIDRDESWAE